MSYRYDTDITVLNQIGKASVEAKAQLYQTYDELRDLTSSGPSIGGSGLGKFSSYLFRLAQYISGSDFIPTLGNQSINIPGTSYYSPFSGGTGISPGGQSSFGLGPAAQMFGFPAAGSAAKLDALSILMNQGFGGQASSQASGIGAVGYPIGNLAIGGLGTALGSSLGGGLSDMFNLGGDDFGSDGFSVGQAAGLAAQIPGQAGGLAAQLSTPGQAASAGAGLIAATGFGRNLVVPTAGLLSGVGGLLTSLAPLFGQSGIAALAAGSIFSGIAGSVLQSYQHVSNRIITNADVILSNKIKNLETTVKMLDAQESSIKKLMKEGIEGDKKALQDL